MGVPCSEYCLYLCLMYFTVCDSLVSIKFQLFEFSESRKKHFHFYDFQRSFTLTFSSDSLFACSWVILFSLSFRSCQSTKTRVTECSLSCFENRVFLYVTMGATERERGPEMTNSSDVTRFLEEHISSNGTLFRTSDINFTMH